MTVDDLADVARWRSEPHVVAWFPHRFADVDEVLTRYGRRLTGDDPVRMFVAFIGGVPIGYAQCFPVASDDDLAVRCGDPDAVGIDYLIGEPDLVGRGLGGEMIDRFCRDIVVRVFPDAPRILAAPDVRNRASIAVLVKNGFVPGLWIEPESSDHVEVVCTAPRSRFE